MAALAACYRRSGDEGSYLKYIKNAQKMAPGPADDNYSLASFEALCGNNKKALDLLEIALEKKLRDPGFAETDPDFDFIKEDPRFVALITKAKAELTSN
jgi:hypothetical protein